VADVVQCLLHVHLEPASARQCQNKHGIITLMHHWPPRHTLSAAHIRHRPWLQATSAVPPASLVPPPAATRKRPLIYIYDLPPEFNTRMLQYRVKREACIYRSYFDGNVTIPVAHNLYGVEMYFHEALATSDHRCVGVHDCLHTTRACPRCSSFDHALP
jgi:hypothetical protein